MNKEQFKRQKIYSTAVHVLQSMVDKQVITSEEFSKAEKALRDEYHPLIVLPLL